MDNCECARLETREGQPVMLLGVKLTGELRGLMFEARVEQRFFNPTDHNVEVVYTFPLPWGAVLLGVDVLLAGKALTGIVVEKKQAEASYEEALSEGNAAIMLEKNHDLSHSLNLGNLAAREHCAVTLRYAQTLQFEQRGLRLLIPSVIAPRYGDEVLDGGLMPHQVPSHELLAEYPFELEIQVHGELAQAHVASPSHPLGMAYRHSEAGDRLTVSLARQALLDRDFVLILDRLTNTSMALAARDCAKPDGVVVLASFCPRISADEPVNTAVKILVDCSGSMVGDSIGAARRALQAIVKQFGKGDRFSLSRFGDRVIHRSRGLWKLTETTRVSAQQWIGDLQADLGGTEMETALLSTFKLAKAVASDVLVITDGEISAIDSTLESARQSGHRVFVVGIGSSPAETHLRRLAEATGGACDFVAPGEAVEPAILRMFARLRSPQLVELSLDWPDGVKPQWVSPLPVSAFDGDTLNVFACLDQMSQGSVRLLGKRTMDAVAEEMGCAHFSGVLEEDNGTLSRLAASARVLSTEGEAESTQLALTYQLVTDKTNFLLIHERDETERPSDMPEFHTVAQMVPAGWGGTGSVRFSIIGDGPVPPIDYVCLSAPSFLRRTVESYAPPSEYIDMPDCIIRKGMDIDRTDQRFWSTSHHYTGLTPLGLNDWLSWNPSSDWPQSYQQLRRIGLGIQIIDWLELSFRDQYGTPLPECRIVEAFLFVMSNRKISKRLVKFLGLAKNLKKKVFGLKALFNNRTDNAPSGVDMELLEKILMALEGMTGEQWPDQIYALTDSRQIAADETAWKIDP